MESKFIRFVKEKDYLIDDIVNGFVLREQNIHFRPSIYTIMPSLVEFWKEKGISYEIIDRIMINFQSMNEPTFWKWLVEEMQADNMFNLNLSYIMTQINRAKIKMKCFTELRDNQKLHPNHRAWFGDYGICLSSNWMRNNRSDRIIYVDPDSEVTNRIGRLMCMLLSVVDGKSTIKAIFDVLAFTEISGNSHEYEWRIVGNHNFAGKSYGTFPDVINFSNDDIIALFVKTQDEVDELLEILKRKQHAEKSKNIPHVILTDSIFLNDEELKEIENIYNRRK